MKYRHNTGQNQPIVNTTDDTSDALLRARTLTPPVCTAADSPTANSGRGMMNARRSINGRWRSMAILIVFAAMLAVCISPVCIAADSQNLQAAGWDSWSSNRPIHINNTGGSALTNYQINISLPDGINETSLRVVNVSSSASVPHWCENVTGGNCYELWFNATDIPEGDPAGGWCNDTYVIYYGNDSASSTSDYNATFTKSYNTSGLVLELHIDEGSGHSQTNDTSGEGNNGTLTNMNTTGNGNATSGWQGVDGGQWDNRSVVFAGDQLRFDGGDDHVNCGNDASLNIADAITVAGWVKGNTQADSRGLISKMSGGVNTRSWSIYSESTSNKLTMILSQYGTYPANCKLYTTSISVLDGTWHHISFTFTSNTLKIYVDGVEDTGVTKTTDNTVSSLYSSSDDVCIGAFSNPSNYLNGDIDEVRIYNRTLSGDEIYRQYIRSKYAANAPTAVLGAAEAPTLSSAARDTDTQITVTMSEDVADPAAANTGGFTVAETGDPGTAYTVSAIAAGASADLVVLTVADMSASGAAGVTVTYTAGGEGLIEDTAGNLLETDATGVAVAAWDTAAPTLDSWTLNIGAKTATLTFNETVNASTLNVTAVTIQNAATATGGHNYTLADSTTASSNGASIVIDLSATDFSAIIADSGLAVNKETSWITITAAAIDDLAGNDVTAITNGNGLQATTYTAGTLYRINVTPTLESLNISEYQEFTATAKDQYGHNKSVTFTWYTNPSGVGTLNATTGSVVNFTARHAGRTEIYAVNGSVSSNATDEVWVTVNATTNTTTVSGGNATATSGDSTAIVNLTNTTVTGMINFTEMGDPVNSSEANGSTTGLGTDVELIKGVDVNVSTNITRTLANDTSGNSYVHIRIDYNQSQIDGRGIDENTLYIYKWVTSSSSWVKLVEGSPSYCVANGRNTTANYVYANVTECSILGLGGSVPSDGNGGGSTGGSTGGGSGTYPPGWFGTPTPTVTATKAPAASATGTATVAPPGERVTPTPTKRPDAAKTTTPAATETAKNGAPGFTAVFVIAGMLAVAYAMMRRRR
uniref:LamG-like jellyroll fold domain-containing protein n=1 Tax=uncultured Methanosarcinales archaeon TaxID=183757 RepID=A0A7H1KNY0_9EURY|nr:hypothetical protein GNCGGNMO_00006 [uncultured Methanosarcinales archaeon]